MPRRGHFIIWTLLATTVFAGWVSSVVQHRPPGDDALITLTYAKNLARGDGFVFNHPPPVLGTTTPLYAVALAAASRCLPSIELPRLAVLLSGLCWAAVGWVLYAFRRPLGLDDWQVAGVALLVTAGGRAQHLDMEAYPFALLLVLAVGLAAAGRWLSAGAACGLLFLTRGEGALAFLLLLVVALARDLPPSQKPDRRRRPATLRLSVGFGAPVLVWCGYALATFGGVLPNTLAAKIAQGSTGLWRPFAAELVGRWLPSWGRELGPGSIPYLNAWYALAVLGFAVVVARRRALLVLPVWAVAYVGGYSLLGVPGYPWYALPAYFVLSLLAGVGLGSTAAWLARRPPRPAVGAMVAALVMALVVVPLAASTARTAVGDVGSERERAYRELAAWFAGHTDPATSIGYHEIGYLGYYTDNRIVDLVGLVDPEVTPHVAAGDFGWGFWRRPPDYFVHLEGSGFAAAIVGDPRFAAAYRPVARFAGFDGRRLTVYERLGVGRRPGDQPV